MSIAPILLFILGGLLGCGGRIGAPAPGARYASAMVFVPTENKTYLFGGRSEGLTGTSYRNDLWTFDGGKRTWAPVRTTRRPPGRGNANLAYDPDRHQLVLFGGTAQTRLGDTWVYDIAGNAWTEITPAVGPPPRSDAGMTYDAAKGKVILFSGYGLEESRDRYDDTWAYDPEMQTWTEMLPVASPPVMYGQAMVYDRRNRRVLLWGGHASAYQNGQATSHWYEDRLWWYDYAGNTWEELTYAPKPPSRYWHLAVADTAGRVLVFGGSGERGFLDDTWITSAEGNAWTRVDTAAAPSPRVNAASAYDVGYNCVILFGGLEEDFTVLRDTWVFEMSGAEGHWVRLASY